MSRMRCRDCHKLLGKEKGIRQIYPDHLPVCQECIKGLGEPSDYDQSEWEFEHPNCIEWEHEV